SIDLLEAGIEVAKPQRLRRGAVGTGNVIPPWWIGPAGRAGPWVAIDDRGAGQAGEIHLAPRRRRQRDAGHAQAALQVPGTAVVVGCTHRSAHVRLFCSSQARTSPAFLSGGKTG